MSAATLDALLRRIGADRALCAFNVETYDFVVAAFRAATSAEVPVVLGVSVPVAESFGYGYLAKLVALIASEFDVQYCLHLDHAEDAESIYRAFDGGFDSANFLNEGALSADDYLSTAIALRDRNPTASLEFVLGTLGHAPGSSHAGADHDHHDAEHFDVDEIVQFAEATRPSVLGFDMGSLHGMTESTQGVDVAAIAEVHARTGLPLVLHGSSGVAGDALAGAIAAGVRKVNIETALRLAYLNAVRTLVAPGGAGERKPRVLSASSSAELETKMVDYLNLYTVTR